MPDLKPFQGIRYRAADRLDALVCPPYDVITPEEQRTLHERHEHNAVRLELAQTGGDPSGYAHVGELFRQWVAEGVLVTEPAPAVYVYRQDFTAAGMRRRVAGVIGALTLEPFGRGVLPHERTMPGPKADRLALLRACPVNISPIVGIYRGRGAAAEVIDALEELEPDGTVTDEDGVLHRMWVVTDPAQIEALTAPVGATPLVIADGHHRYETALAYHAERDGTPGGHGAMMCCCVDADAEDLYVLPYHRLVSGGPGPGELAGRLTGELAAVEVDAGAAEEALRASPADHAFVFVVGDRSLLVEVDDAYVEARAEGPKAWRDLDVVALHEAVLPQLVSGTDTEVSFTKDAVQVRRTVASGEASFGVLLRAVAPVEVVDVAVSGARMPQKASYFWPKALTGLVFRSLR